MIYSTGTKFYALLNSWNGPFVTYVEASAELQNMVVEAVIRAYDAESKGYTVSYDAVFEEHTKFQTYFSSP